MNSSEAPAAEARQEYWSRASGRVCGLHRSWLPPVAVKQLKGISGMMDINPGVPS